MTTNLAATGAAAAYFEFNRAIIDAVADIVPAVKPQIAMYEALGPAGIDCYTMTCQYARENGLYVIGDIKRGDIGSTAAAYASATSNAATSGRPPPPTQNTSPASTGLTGGMKMP